MQKSSSLTPTALVAASLLWASAIPASAIILAPGGSGAPDVFGAISGSVIADTGVVGLTSAPASFTSTYDEQVVRDGVTGLLDFVIQTTNNALSRDAIERMTLSSFTGFVTDVGTATSAGGLSGGTVAPLTVTRGAAGDVIGFNFGTTPPNLLSAGMTSLVLVIKTNATTFIAGTVSQIDSGVATGAGFAPGIVTPLPAALPLFATGLGAIGLLGWRRKRKAQFS